MFSTLGLILICQQTPRNVPRHPSDLVGTYRMSGGFSSSELVFKDNGTLSISTAHDHPGPRSKQVGKWRFDGDTIFVEIWYRSRHKLELESYMWAPVVFGDRLMIVDVNNLLDGQAVRVLSDVGKVSKAFDRWRRFGTEPTDVPFPVRVNRVEGASLRMYGKVRTTKLYESLISEIPELKVPVSSGR